MATIATIISTSKTEPTAMPVMAAVVSSVGSEIKNQNSNPLIISCPNYFMCWPVPAGSLMRSGSPMMRANFFLSACQNIIHLTHATPT